jgi:hypothetical protein
MQTPTSNRPTSAMDDRTLLLSVPYGKTSQFRSDLHDALQVIEKSVNVAQKDELLINEVAKPMVDEVRVDSGKSSIHFVQLA